MPRPTDKAQAGTACAPDVIPSHTRETGDAGLLVRAEGLSFRYPGSPLPVWQGLDIEIRKGDRLLLSGPSGSGKSTLLGILTGLVPRLTSGKTNGHIERFYRSYGLVMQNPYAQLVTPTVFEELAFGLENAGMAVADIRDKVRHMLARMRLSAFADRLCATLSGGEAQRLSLACALIAEPELIFLDEPTAYLDPWSADEFFRMLEEIPGSTGIVIVEHRIGEARSMFNRVFSLDGQGGGRERRSLDPALPTFGPESRIARQNRRFGSLNGGGTSVLGPSVQGAGIFAIRSLSHSFGEHHVLRDLDLVLCPGSITVVMGPSGSGKSTLLDKIAGWLPASGGKGGNRETIRWGARDWLAEKPKDRAGSIQYLPQNPEHFFLTMSVREELAYAGSNKNEIEKTADRFGLSASMNMHPCSLSEGEKRRLNLACAFLDPRPLILMDEPSYGLDPAALATLVDGLDTLRDQGGIILIVTHSPELAIATADDLYFMNAGKLEKKNLDTLTPQGMEYFAAGIA